MPRSCVAARQPSRDVESTVSVWHKPGMAEDDFFEDRYYLLDDAAVKAKIEGVANQGKAG